MSARAHRKKDNALCAVTDTKSTKNERGIVMIIKMKLRDFIKLEEDIDVYDDVCEEIGIAFCGAMELTEEGAEHFAEVLDYDMSIDTSGDYATAVVHVDDEDEKTWKHKLRKAKEFFYSAAGYCDADDWDRWFKVSD